MNEIFKNDNTSATGCNRSAEAENLNKLPSNILSHTIEEISNPYFNNDDIIEEYLDQQSSSSLPDLIKDCIDSGATLSEAEADCVDFVINLFQKNSPGNEATFDEFDNYNKMVYNLLCNAVEYHNTVNSGSQWDIPEKLSKYQSDRLISSIPVSSMYNLPKIINDITSDKLKEFMKNHAEDVPLISTDPKKDWKNFCLDSLIEDIMRSVNIKIRNLNTYHDNRRKHFSELKSLTNKQIVDIIIALFPVKSIQTQDSIDVDGKSLLLSIYINDPADPLYGTYSNSVEIFRRIINCLNENIDLKAEDEIIAKLRLFAPRIIREDDRDLIAVNNGIFNYKTKELKPFSCERVFTSKSKVNYVKNPVLPVLRYLPDGTDTGEDWDVETWMHTLHDDDEVVELLWKIIGAIIRPNNRWNISAWLYSECGNSGKGTLCELMRQICGEGCYASIALSDFSKEFYLEQLTHVSAIITDENDVGSFIDKAANLKAVITNDVLVINRKYKVPLTFQFKGFTVQCLNEFPRFKDKSESFYRRQLFVPMPKCFTGKEKKYIKDFYLHDQKVLEYVLHKVLNMNYYTLEAPAACRALLNEYKTYNDPVRLFFEEIKNELVWDRIPFDVLYDIYRGWMNQNIPNGQIIAKKQFTMAVKSIVRTDPIWSLPDNQLGNFRITVEMKSQYEPLIIKYAQNWLAPTSFPIIPGDTSHFQMNFEKDVYYGIIRRNSASTNISEISDD